MTGRLGRLAWAAAFIVLSAATSFATESSGKHPLEPPDRSSPRATIDTFLDAVDNAWELYSARDPGYVEPFLVARECLDLSDVPPLFFREVSAKSALFLKDVLDRIELPSPDAIPDAAMVEEQALSRWTIPHTEITLVLIHEGDRHGQWLFSKATVARAEDFYNRARHLDLKPGRLGGHLEELRTESRAVLLLKLVDAMPEWFSSEIGGMLVWQWFGVAVLLTGMVLAVALIAWLARWWRSGRFPGHRLAPFLTPLALGAVPTVGDYMIHRTFSLPGEPALLLRLVFSIVGDVGLMWLVALVLTRLGDLVVRVGFRDARPLKVQLVQVLFRITTIAVVTGISLRAAHNLGVPVAGLIAGLGVGGLAIALAAQSTLENFIGGIILYADQPVRVGDFCRFGDRRGLVEAVGLRSTRIRTLDRTLVTIPNATFAKMQLENLSGRDRILLREKIRFSYETSREQLQRVMTELEAMLRGHPELSDERLRVRFNGFGQYYQEVELYAYADTGEWPEFTRIREEILLKVMDIIESSPTRLALPTEIHYAAGAAPPNSTSRLNQREV